jgi:hypothetical protein
MKLEESPSHLMLRMRGGLGERADEMMISEQPYLPSDPDVEVQTVALAGSGADVFLNLAIPKFAAQAIMKATETGWSPFQLIAGVSHITVSMPEVADLDATRGTISTNFQKNPQDPRWAEDEGVRRWNAFMDEYHPEGNKATRSTQLGHGVTQALEHVLKASWDDLTRAGVMRAASSMEDVELDLLLPGITLDTSERDSYPIEQMQLMRFDGERWELFGEVVDASASAMGNWRLLAEWRSERERSRNPA